MIPQTAFRTIHRCGGRLSRLVQDRFGASARRGLLGLADQALVSGSRFTATVLMGRLCGARELGFYGLAFTVIILLTCVQESLITLPYTAAGRRRQGKRGEFYAGSVLLQAVAMWILAALGMATWVLCQSGASGLGGQTRVFAVVAVFLPAILLWEFGRRIGFAQLRVGRVFVLDACTAMCWLMGIGVLAFVERLSAVTAYAAFGTACGVVTLVWFTFYRQRLRFSRRRLWQDTRRHVAFGRWILGSEALLVTRSYIVPWLVVWLLGTRETGIFIAYMTVVFLANPLLLGLGNVLAPDMARAFASGGAKEIRRIVNKLTPLLGIVVAGFCLVLVLTGELIVRHLYGDSFTGQSYCVMALAVGLLAEAIAMPSYNGLWAIHRPDICFFACLIGIVATLAVTLALTPTLGLVGAAIGLSSGKVVASTIQCVRAHAIIRDIQAESVPQEALA